MSTVDYTRYTRIIHCRPCCNVYVSVIQRGAVGHRNMVTIESWCLAITVECGQRTFSSDETSTLIQSVCTGVVLRILFCFLCVFYLHLFFSFACCILCMNYILIIKCMRNASGQNDRNRIGLLTIIIASLYCALRHPSFSHLCICRYTKVTRVSISFIHSWRWLALLIIQQLPVGYQLYWNTQRLCRTASALF